MKILNFDTSLDKTYITLSDNENIIMSKIIENQENKYHSAFLIPTIVEILKTSNLTIQDIDLIATNLGPGSFTGIRACLVVARTLCQQANIRALGCSSLEILSRINTTELNTLVVLDARKNMAYVEILDKSGNILMQPCAKPIEEVIEIAKSNKYFIIGDEVTSKILTDEKLDCVNYKDKNYDLGIFLNEIVQNFVSKNSEYDYNWAKLKPLYIQPPPISKPKERV